MPGALHVELGALTEATGAVPDQPVQTYYIMAGSFLSGPGGNLVLNASESHPPEPVHVDVTLDEVGSVDPRTGTAWLSGTVTCTGAELVDFVRRTAPARRTGDHHRVGLRLSALRS